MILTGKHLPRRTMLKGLGVSLALPLLDAMAPAALARGQSGAGAKRVRLVAIEMVHGSAGSTAFGIKKNLWAPAETGRAFDLSPSSLKPLEPFRDHINALWQLEPPITRAEVDAYYASDARTYATCRAYAGWTAGCSAGCSGASTRTSCRTPIDGNV